MDSVAAPRPTAIDGRSTLLVLAGLDTCSISIANMVPLLLGLLIDERGASATSAGLAASLEQAGLLLGMLGYAAFKRHAGTRNIATLALSAIVVGSILTIILPLPGLLAARLLFGCGVGVILALVFAIVSRRSRPQRDYAVLAVVTLTTSAVLLVLASEIARRGGLAAFCGLAAVMATSAILLASRLPPIEDVETSRPVAAIPAWDRRLVALAAAGFLNYLAHSALWAFQGRMAGLAGASPTMTGLLLGLSTLGGVFGALWAVRWGDRAGYGRPQAIGSTILVLCSLLLAMSMGKVGFLALFAIAAVLIKVGWFLGYPYLQGAASLLDRSGRGATVVGGAQLLGAISGPLLGALLTGASYLWIPLAAAACYSASAILAVSISARISNTAD